MKVQSKRAIGMAVVAAVALGGVAAPVSPASSKTIKVCVKKKTGEMRMMKKCKKGWKKVKWNSVGPIGPIGPAGPQLKVVDKNGVVLGDFLGMSCAGLLPYITVGFQGGNYTYMPDGRLIPSTSPRFIDATCAGKGYVAVAATDTPMYLNTVGGPGRLVYRATVPVWQTAKAYKLTSTLRAHNAVTWQLDGAGTCAVTAVYNGTLIELEEVPAPPDGAGPLTVK
ncbi:MAG: hypothetical protein H6526_04940 [Actinobacteria bacterium]|nr:hypothetical protein [Actinomycetota bacterium]MCB8997249.1 hypothetical protein [Actinomycetota bacterium]MCB9414611.1 hypothetical protein [Actinomycetota bacterium]MCB9423561.1 hypothetical protein [Actinomycetota bacterium]HRY09023.1 hypothetical protein [Candidatus Nanopelagicales bacterium]